MHQLVRKSQEWEASQNLATQKNIARKKLMRTQPVDFV